MYVEQYKKFGLSIAEAWTNKNIAREDRAMFQKYVVAELMRKGYKGIVPGDV